MVVNSTIAETTVHRLIAIDVLLSHSMIDRVVVPNTVLLPRLALATSDKLVRRSPNNPGLGLMSDKLDCHANSHTERTHR